MSALRMPQTASPDAVRAFVALGANLGNAAASVQAAFDALDALPNTRIVARSPLYATAPVGVSGQPDYINAVAAIDTTLPAGALLRALLDIEARQGRTRNYHHAPRTLDLDLLLYGNAQLNEPGLEVPHPRMHARAFVLVPLADIAPELTIPGRGRVRDLLPGVAGQGITRLTNGQ